MNGNGTGDTLALFERDRLDALETVIEHGQAVFVAVGDALQEIRESRLYRETHATFESYCRERWGWGRNFTNKTIAAAEVVGVLGTTVPTPEVESHARELAPLRDRPDALRSAWGDAQDIASQRGQPMTAAIVREAVRGRVQGEAAASIAEMDTAAAHLSVATRAALSPEMCRQRGEFKRLIRDLAGLAGGSPDRFAMLHRGYIEDFAVADARRAAGWLAEFLRAWEDQ